MMINDWDEPQVPRPRSVAAIMICIAIIACLLWPLFIRAGVREQLYVADAESRAQAGNRRDLPSDFDKGQQQQGAVAEAANPRYPRMLFFHADWCKPCVQALDDNNPNSFRAWLRKSQYQVDDTDRAHVQLVDFDDHIELAMKYGVTRLPSLVLLRSDRVCSEATDYTGRQSIVDLFETLKQPPAVKAPPPRKQPIAAAAPLKLRSQITDALGKFRQYAGDQASLKWDRTGKQSFSLLQANTDWSAEALFGQSGRIEMSAPGSPLMVKDAGFAYRVIGEDISIDLDPILLAGMAKRLNPRPSVGASVEPVGIEPMTVLTILQVIRGLYLLLHPSVDLELGGNVACDLTLVGEVLTVKFSQCPRIRITAYWQWLLGVDTVIVSPSKIHVDFANTPGVMFPIRSREWSVE